MSGFSAGSESKMFVCHGTLAQELYVRGVVPCRDPWKGRPLPRQPAERALDVARSKFQQRLRLHVRIGNRGAHIVPMRIHIIEQSDEVLAQQSDLQCP